jgi:hypothetical protein
VNRLRRRLRFKRIRVLVPSPEAEKLIAQYDERLATQHRRVHRLEDRIAQIEEPARTLIACASAANSALREHTCAMCEHQPGTTSEFCPCGCHHVWQRIYGDGVFPAVKALRVALDGAENGQAGP